MSIDFSKAPEGATHFDVDDHGEAWWYYLGGDGAWRVHCGSDLWALSQRQMCDSAIKPIPTTNDLPPRCNRPNGSERAATAEQPAPKGAGNPILGMVLADLTDRALIGREKYGEALLAHNGRNPLWDAYQEALDLAMYLRQAIEEQK